jgi:hypothetical protein
MKTLQRNFTTPEQSKRLLEIGVPAWTADCYYKESGKIEVKNTALDILYPSCWSVGRLIEIHRASTTLPEEQYMFPFWYDTQDNVEWAIRVLESGIRTGNIDFSKLEE